MELKNPLVSVNLLTYNGEKYIQDCLDSINRQSYANLEILIIDNCSTDKTRDYLKGFPVIFNKENIGFAAGHNQAIRESRGELILCLNQDVILDKDFIKAAVRPFQTDKKIASLQGKLLRPKGPLDCTGLVFLKNRRIICRGQGEIDRGQFEKSEEIFGADGAAPVYRRQALEDIKIKQEYFDEDFFCYKEDVDLAWRLKLYGWKAIYQPKAIAWHWRGSGDSAARWPWQIIQERRKINKFSKYLSFKNQRLMQIKNERLGSLLKHLIWWLPKEIAAWLYLIFFERFSWPAIRDLFKQLPSAWQKRKIIMSQRNE